MVISTSFLFVPFFGYGGKNIMYGARFLLLALNGWVNALI
jgi:hypothetical protein